MSGGFDVSSKSIYLNISRTKKENNNNDGSFFVTGAF